MKKQIRRLLKRGVGGMLVILFAGLLGLFFVFRDISEAAVTAFLGVLIGSSVTGLVQYWISELDRNQEFRLAAFDSRLAAYQQAYTLWIKLRFAERPHGLRAAAVSCQNWWDTNCLLLSQDASDAFHRAIMSATSYAALFEAHEEASLLTKAWAEVEAAGDVIRAEARLPSISDLWG